MKVKIRYESVYRYGSEVSFSPHVFRLFPKPDPCVTIERAVFATNDGADVQYRKDLFDNSIAACFFPKKSTEMSARLEIDLNLREKNAFHFLLDSHALDFPFFYSAEEMRALAPYLPRDDDRALHLPFWNAASKPTVAALVELNESIFRNLRYERRDSGAARLAQETLRLRAGACRDFAVLLAAALRSVGIAARLVSGYLCEFGVAEKRAEGALHAWTEAYLPGAGWVGMDPTNGTFCDHHHIAAAVGLQPEDISPISGTYYSATPVTSAMSASLELIQSA